MNRRTLLAAVAALALAGCATTGTSPATVTDAAAANLKLIADALLPLAGTIATMAGATPDIVSQISVDVANLEAAAAAVQPGIAQAVAQPSVSTVGAALQSILGALSAITLPANVQAVLTAAQTLLPLVQAAVGIAIAVGAARTGAMLPAEAKAVLAAAAVR